MSLPRHWSGVSGGWGAVGGGPCIHPQVIVTVDSSMGTVTMELTLFPSLVGLFTVRDPQNAPFLQSCGGECGN